jgi:hypothetical protein
MRKGSLQLLCQEEDVTLSEGKVEARVVVAHRGNSWENWEAMICFVVKAIVQSLRN